MSHGLLCLLMLATLCPAGFAQERLPARHNGSICVAPVKGTGDEREHVSDSFAVRINDRGWVAVPRERSTLIPDLSIDRKHLVRIRDGRTQIESFRFEFNEFTSRDLCLWYKSWYATWSLWDSADGGSKCRCTTKK